MLNLSTSVWMNDEIWKSKWSRTGKGYQHNKIKVSDWRIGWWWRLEGEKLEMEPKQVTVTVSTRRRRDWQDVTYNFQILVSHFVVWYNLCLRKERWRQQLPALSYRLCLIFGTLHGWLLQAGHAYFRETWRILGGIYCYLGNKGKLSTEWGSVTGRFHTIDPSVVCLSSLIFFNSNTRCPAATELQKTSCTGYLLQEPRPRNGTVLWSGHL